MGVFRQDFFRTQRPSVLAAILAVQAATQPAAGTVSPSIDVAGAGSVTRASVGASSPTIDVAGASLTGGMAVGAVAPTIAVAGADSTSKAASSAVAPTIAVAGASSVLRAAAGTVSPSIAVAGASKRFPLTIHASGRYFVDAQGAPILIKAIAAWILINNATEAEWAEFFDDILALDFNSVEVQMTNPVEYFSGDNSPASLAAGGALPFLLNASGGTWDGDPTFQPAGWNPSSNPQPGNFDALFSSANDTYFDKLVTMARVAAARGIWIWFTPMYIGFDNGALDGWWQTLVASQNTSAVCFAFGQYLGNKFKNEPNIIWEAGVDTFPAASSTGETRLHKIFEGIQNAGDTHLITGHWKHDYLATDSINFRDLITVQGIYTHGPYPTFGPTYGRARLGYDYTHSPTLPTILVETAYVDNHSFSRAQLRYEQYGAFISCVAGGLNGSHELWMFYSGWQSHLTSGANLPYFQDQQRLHAFFGAIPWWTLVPDGLAGTATIVTTGQGTYTTMASPGDSETGGTDWIVSSRDPSGNCLVAYFPHDHSGAATINTAGFSGTFRGRWLDPTNGTFTNATGTPFSPVSTHAFTTPGANAAGDNDWVLLLELSSQAGAGTVSPSTDIAGGSSASKAGSSAVAPTTAIAGTSTASKAAAGAAAPATDIAGTSIASKASAGASAPSTDIAGADTVTKAGGTTVSPSTDIGGAGAQLDAASTAVAPTIAVAGASSTAASGSAGGSVSPSITVAGVAAMLGGAAGTVAPSFTLSAASAALAAAAGASAPSTAIAGGGTSLAAGSTAAAPSIAVSGGSSVLRAASTAVAPSVDVAGVGNSAAAGSGAATVSPTISVGGTSTATKASATAAAPATDVGGASAEQASATATSSPTTAIAGASSAFHPLQGAGASAPTTSVSGASSSIFGAASVGTVSPTVAADGATARLCSALAAALASADAAGASAVLRFAMGTIAPTADVSGITPHRHPPEIVGRLTLKIDGGNDPYTLTVDNS